MTKALTISPPTAYVVALAALRVAVGVAAAPAAGTPTLTSADQPVRIIAAAAVAAAAPPATFTANPSIDPPGRAGQGQFKDSAHFRLYNAPNEAGATMALSVLEACYSCFVEDLGWRSSGLSATSASDVGPWDQGEHLRQRGARRGGRYATR